MDANLDSSPGLDMSPKTTPVVMNPTQNMNDLNSIVNVSSDNKGNTKKVWIIVGILIILGAVGIATYVVQKQSFTQSKAWNCTLYTFSVSQSGVVTVANNQTRSEPVQQAKVYINDVLVDTLAVPALAQGEDATLGVVSVPTDEGFTWEVDGTVDCNNAGSYEVENSPTPTLTTTISPTVTLTITPTDEPDVTPTPTDEVTETPTPTDEPDVTPTDGPTSTPTDGPTNTPKPTGDAEGTGDALADAGFGTPTWIALGAGFLLMMGALVLAL